MQKFVIIGILGALVVGSFSGAWAAATITGADIVDGSIKSIDIGDKTVANVDLATDAVDGNKIKNLSIKTSDLGDSIVTSGKIKDATIADVDIATDAVGGDELKGVTKLLFFEIEDGNTLEPQQFGAIGQAMPGVEFGDNVIVTSDGDGQVVVVGAKVVGFEGDPGVLVTVKNDGDSAVSYSQTYSIIVYRMG
jgi:hypothetical protein